MNTKQPKWHLERGNIKLATTALTLSKAVLIMTGDIAIGLFKAFHPHPYYHTFCHHRENSFNATLSRLKKEGYVKIAIQNGQSIFMLTEKGDEKRREALGQIKRAGIRTQTWDKKWRVLIFDIPEKMKRYRDFLREEIYEYGFVQLQKSVWVTPYRVDDDVRVLVNEYNLSGFVKLAIVEKWDNDSELRKLFRLT